MEKCFIITPYGKKFDANGKRIDFDEIFKLIVEPAVIDAGLQVVRSDKNLESVVIFQKMIQDIASAEVCVADITTLNANVFYELGVRHALCRNVTVLIRLEGQPLPFDISSLNVFAYGPIGPIDKINLKDRKVADAVKKARSRITAAIQSARAQKDSSSLVFNSLKDLSVSVEKPTPYDAKASFALKKDSTRHIGLVGGAVSDVDDVSVWVNSENTEMQMSRYYEPTISGSIRYHGATKDNARRVKTDWIADALAAWMREHGHTNVDPGTVIKTTSGELAEQGVKFVLHVAAVYATPGRGYHPVSDLRSCVKNVLKAVEKEKEVFGDERASILVPLLGTGSGGGRIEDVAPELFKEALDYLERTPGSIIDKVWFLAYSRPQWNACMKVMSAAPLANRLHPVVYDRLPDRLD